MLSIQKDKFELNIDPKDSVFIRRQFLGKTSRDLQIEKLPIPTSPLWLFFLVKIIRFYQNRISTNLGNRCVYDPSCSHYAEIAYREKGFVRGTILTLKRLYRCRPKNGGVDELDNY